MGEMLNNMSSEKISLHRRQHNLTVFQYQLLRVCEQTEAAG